MANRSDTIGKMKGGVRKRGKNGLWGYQIDLGLQPALRCRTCNHRVWIGPERHPDCPKCGGALRETRERRLVDKGGYRTRQQAQEARSDQQRSLRDGTFVAPVRMTLAEYLRDRWLPAIEAEGLKGTTVSSYRSIVANHLIGPDDVPFLLGQTPLQKVTRDAVRAHYGHLAKSGKADGGALSPASLRRVHAVLSRAFNDALENGLVVRNPVQGLAKRLPRSCHGSGKVKAWTGSELATFLASVREHRLFALWHLLALTGMRRGEALALRWEDIDLQQGTVSVSKSRTPVGNGIQEGGTKTGRSRVVQLDPGTVQVLKDHAERQAGEMAKAGAWPDEPYVFTTSDGKPLDPRSVSRQFERAVGKATVPVLSAHGLRHTHATVALLAGVHPKVVQERLGHASIAITLDTYSHVIKQLDAGAAATIAEAITLTVKEG